MIEIGYSDGTNHKLKSGQVGYPDGTNHKLRLIEVGGADGVNHVVWRNAIPYTATTWGTQLKVWEFSEPLLVYPEDWISADFSFDLGGPYKCSIDVFIYFENAGQLWYDKEGESSYGVSVTKAFKDTDYYGKSLTSNDYITSIQAEGSFTNVSLPGTTTASIEVNGTWYNLAQSGEIEGY